MKDGAYILKKDMSLPFGINFKGGKEIVVSNQVVCIDGFPLPAEMQTTIMNWLIQNQNYLVKTRSW